MRRPSYGCTTSRTQCRLHEPSRSVGAGELMKIKCFQDTDTLCIEFRGGGITETRDLDENTLLELDDQGRVCAMIMEHASKRTDIPGFSDEQIAL